MRRWMPLVLLAIAATAFAAPPTITVTPLTPAEIPALLKPPVHGERILMFWSLDCAYCEPNMQALAKLQRAHPRTIELVTVDTDDIRANRATIAQRLGEAGMQGYAARAYMEASSQRMNFLVDPNWGGVLPHTIVIRADGTRVAFSGELTADQLQRIEP